jgi:hypothetical protein
MMSGQGGKALVLVEILRIVVRQPVGKVVDQS